MNPPNPDDHIGFLILDTARLLVLNFNRRAEKEGLTTRQWRTLAELFRNEGINQSTLAELLEVQPITMTRIVDRLEEAGWVERRPDPSDRRAVTLHSTKVAGPLHEKLWRLGIEDLNTVMGDLSAKEQKILLMSLQSMKKNLTDHVNTPR